MARSYSRSALRQKLVVREDFEGFGAAVDEGIREGLAKTARRAQGRIRSHAPVGDARSGVRPGHMKDTIRTTSVERTARGYEVNVASSDPTALWQEMGTHARKGRAKTKRTAQKRAAAGISRAGVKPKRFFRKGLAEAWPGVVDDVKRATRYRGIKL